MLLLNPETARVDYLAPLGENKSGHSAAEE